MRMYLPYLVLGVKQGILDTGADSVQKLKQLAENGELKFELRSPAAQREGGIHTIISRK
jgi:IMP dehydrogenase